MKEIIYLDTGVLHSFMAQHNDGLPTGTSNERSEEVNDVTEKAQGYNSRSNAQTKLKTGAFKVPLIFNSPEGELTGVYQPGNFASEKSLISQTESGKEIISKQLHDNALVQFEQHLTENNQLFSIGGQDIEGKFVKCKSEFKIIDFKYLKQIIQTDTLIEFMFMKDEEDVRKIKDELEIMKDGKQKVMKKALFQAKNSTLESQKKTLHDQFSYFEKSLNYLNEILPTEAFIVVDDAIAPLKNDYLREKGNELTFKYGGSNIQITMIGKVTSKIGNTNMPSLNENDLFFEFPKILNFVLSPLGVLTEGDLIISPVAIYFE